MQNLCYVAVDHATDLSGNKHGFRGHIPELRLVVFDPFCVFLLLDVHYDNNYRQQYNILSQLASVLLRGTVDPVI